jgi:hypothetical protein
MKIVDFKEHYPDEHSCRMDMKAKREKSGLSCTKCESTRLHWMPSRYMWHCNDCDFRITLCSGTVMQDSKLPLYTWYMCMALMTQTRKPISAHEMRRQLGMKRYEPVWAMMHKLREAMGQRDSRYLLEGTVEFDEAYMSVATQKDTKLKRGRGSQRKQNVAVMAESTPLEDIETGKTGSHCRYFKLKVLESQAAEQVNECVSNNVDSRAIVLSDKSTSYVDIADLVEGHVTCYSDKDTVNTTLKWVHIAISNAKRTLLGIYHCIRERYLQHYLDEFCYKLNRRYFGDRLFDRLTFAVAASSCTQAD